jgi:2-polyprenyl-3-methyl-5-hydroxy-6-metoxy-1,4-benzoquinol methylase
LKGLIKRELVLLPNGWTSISFKSLTAETLLPLNYTYRASPEGIVKYEILTPGRGLAYKLYETSFTNNRLAPGRLILDLDLPSVHRGDTLSVSLLDSCAWLNGIPVASTIQERGEARRVIAEFQILNGDFPQTRSCLHYFPFQDKAIGKDYYFSGNYPDYPTNANPTDAVRLVRRYCATGKLLDVGCALGIYSQAFLNDGFDAYGFDVSQFAVEEAQKTLGSHRIQQCDIDNSEVPFDFTFDVVWASDVLEHSKDPHGLLGKIDRRTTSGSYLFLHTSNCDSLTHRLFGKDWEGYADYSHHGVDLVSEANLYEWLEKLNWQVIDAECTEIWAGGVDPVLERLQEVFRKIPELSTFLSERSFGDMIKFVARKV